jgi:hypothetical protein
MKKPHTPRFTLLATAFLISGLPAHAQSVAQPQLSPNSNSITVKDYLGKWRLLLDADKDGWDDLWCHLHRDLKHRDKSIDTDGDSLTDYEEMVMWRDPYTKGPIPKELTPEEIKQAELEAEKNQVRVLEEAKKAWPAREAELVKTVQPSFAAGKDAVEPENVKSDNAALRAKLTARIDKANAEKAFKRQQLDTIKQKYDALDRQHGFKRENRGTIVGEGAAGPIIMTPQDATSSNTINADDLWPLDCIHSKIPAYREI